MDSSQESQEKVHSGMKNSSANDAQSADGAARDLDADQGHPATDAPGLTYASGGKHSEELPWVTPRSRRANLTPKGDSQVSGVSPPSFTTNEQVFRDPFGLSEAPAYLDPAWCKRFPAARTKQSARRSTTVEDGTPPGLTTGEQALSSKPHSGSSSDGSRGRLGRKGCVLATRAAEAASKMKKLQFKHAQKAAKKAAESQTEESTHGESSDGSDSGVTKAAGAAPSPTQGNQKATVTLPATGRFNGRVHATPIDGSCGPASLLEALTHLAHTQGYHFNLPVDAFDMRQALIADIRENLDCAPGSNPGSVTLGQEIEAEYFPGDLLLEQRHGIFAPDLDEEHETLVENAQEYLTVMALNRTHMDEFMIATFARMWNVRVAVIRAQKKGKTTEHSQFVPPGEVLPAERTIFLYRSGRHFEWAHANATPCQDPRCHGYNKRVSASHTPICMPPAQGQSQTEDQAKKQPAKAAIPAGSQPSRGVESDLDVLISQLIEEYPGIDPERAEAALKLTKTGGRYNLYTAAAVLRGMEGAPIVPDESPSPSSSASSDEQSEKDTAGSVYFTDGTGDTGTDQDSCGEDDKRKRRHTDTSSEDEDAAINARAAAFANPTRTQPRSHLQGHVNASNRTGCCGQHEHKVQQTCGGRHATAGSAAEAHIQRYRELHQSSLRQEAARAEAEQNRSVRMAAQVISVAAGKTLTEAYEALQRHIVMRGDLAMAAQCACEELMAGPRQAKPAARVNDVPDNDGISLTEKQLGKGACTPTVQALAKRSRAGTESPPHPKCLFDKAFNTQMQNTGGNLTAAQRLATAVRRADDSLWRQALDRQYASNKAAAQDERDGDTPESAALLGPHTLRAAMTAGAAPASSAYIPRAATSHTSPGVRIAEQMRLKREQAACAPQGQNTVVVVSSNGNKLPVWKPGAEIDGRGFNWRTKQKMVQAWEQYQLSEGLHAPKTFKSMIDAELVPNICAECNLEEGDWEVLDDVVLLSAIEERLRPHDSMDFTVQLKRIPFSNDATSGTLTQRYRLFAEAFLAKVSEAKAAGCKLQENVIKNAFTRAVSTCAILQGWLEQEKWVNASETHRRITNHLKMVDAYEALSGMSSGRSAQQPHTPESNNKGARAQQQHQSQQQVQQQQPPQHLPTQQQHSRFVARQQQQQQHFNQHISSAVNAALSAYQQAELQRQATAESSASVNAMSSQTQMSLPPFPGLDGRGLSWHICSPLLECRCSPCTAKFCQACAVHGHTVENCRKRLFKNPGANLSGYWCEQQPGRGPMRAPTPAPGVPTYMQAPAPGAASFTAPTYMQTTTPGAANPATATQQQQAFPTPYQMNGGGAARPAGVQHAAQQTIGAAHVNNTAQRSSKVTFSDQQQSPANDTAQGGHIQ
jgi:hypothetical protein